mmetsp:Transcript_15065/g.22423  ORF Transcript_15065/g.22423 Transcript_15065/m.22423 type:complete len:344 (+) Transcript_15065:114-1145(+)
MSAIQVLNFSLLLALVCFPGAASAEGHWLKHGHIMSYDTQHGTIPYVPKDGSRLKKLANAAQTDMGLSNRHICIVTTASLPWMTGTSINPLMRAAMLTEGRQNRSVTLFLPFLPNLEDQKKIFPGGITFVEKSEQEKFVKNWLRKIGLSKHAEKMKIVFYDGTYNKNFGSILPSEDIIQHIPKEEADICILEEPEHINWLKTPSTPWTTHFEHVVGIIHTNYLAYSSNFTIFSRLLTFLLKRFNVLVVRSCTDKIIKLSSTIQFFAQEKETVCNVHGVRDHFLEIGKGCFKSGEKSKKVYFIGKSLWSKGHRVTNIFNQSNLFKSLSLQFSNFSTFWHQSTTF